VPAQLEETQIGRRLVLLGRHQQAVGTQIIHFLADADMRIALVAEALLVRADRVIE
jgi:hypothetical protein